MNSSCQVIWNSRYTHVNSMWSQCGVQQKYLKSMWSWLEYLKFIWSPCGVQGTNEEWPSINYLGEKNVEAKVQTEDLLLSQHLERTLLLSHPSHPSHTYNNYKIPMWDGQLTYMWLMPPPFLPQSPLSPPPLHYHLIMALKWCFWLDLTGLEHRCRNTQCSRKGLCGFGYGIWNADLRLYCNPYLWYHGFI